MNDIEYYPCDFGFLVLRDGWLAGWVERIPQNKNGN